MQKTSITFFVPCLNEEKLITKSLNSIYKACKGLKIKYEVLVVDDGSTDNSVDKIKNFIKEKKIKKIKLIKNKKNLGLGYNYFVCSFVAKGKYYMLINGDNAETVKGIKNLVLKIGAAEIIIPYFNDKDNRYFFRRLLSKIFTLIINIISLTNVKYYNGSVIHLTQNVRIYRSNTFGFGYQAEMICKLLHMGKNYLEVNIENINRDSGISKAFKLKNMLSIINTFITIFIDTISTYIQKIIR